MTDNGNLSFHVLAPGARYIPISGTYADGAQPYTVDFGDPTFRHWHIADGCLWVVFTDHHEIYPLANVIDIQVIKNTGDGDSFYPVRRGALREQLDPKPGWFNSNLRNLVAQGITDQAPDWILLQIEKFLRIAPDQTRDGTNRTDGTGQEASG